MAKKKDLTVEERIVQEHRRLMAIYKDMEAPKKNIATGLIGRAAFMRVQLEDLEMDLLENGWTEPFSQGNQDPYDRARPAAQIYNTTNANYQKIIKQLDGMLPKAQDATSKKDDDDGFDAFVNGRGEV